MLEAPNWEIEKYKRHEMVQSACIKAIAASAGFAYTVDEIDYGLDVTLNPYYWNENRGKYEREIDTQLNFQLKTSINWDYYPDNDNIRYKLSSKNYNHMVSRNIKADQNTGKPWTPMLLALMCLPKNGQEPLTLTRFSTVFKRANFWYILNRQETEYIDESTTKTIYIPKKNILTVSALRYLMSLAYLNWPHGGCC